MAESASLLHPLFYFFFPLANENFTHTLVSGVHYNEYQANVNTLIGSLRDKLAEAVFSRNPSHRQKKLERIMLEIQKSVVPIRPDDGTTPRYENTRKSNFHHNKRSNL